MTSEAPPFYLVGAEGLRERFAGRAKAVEQTTWTLLPCGLIMRLL